MKPQSFKIIILLLLFAIGGHSMYAQSNKKKKKKGKGDFIKELSVQPFSEEVYINLGTDQIDVPKKIISKMEHSSMVKQEETADSKLLQVTLQEGELVLNFEEQSLETDQYNVRTVDIKLNNQPLSLPPEMVQKAAGAIHWYGVAEQYPDLEGNLAIDVKVTTWGTETLLYDVRCEEPMPAFTSKQKQPYWIVGGASLVALGVGRLLREQSDEIYEIDYEPITATNAADHNAFYDSANNKHKQSRFLSFVGGGLLLADAILLLIRQDRHKKRVQIFKSNCMEPSLSWQPMVDFSSLGLANGQVGMKVQFTF